MRLPPARLAASTDALIEGMREHDFWGYVLFAVTLAFWTIHAKWQRRIAFSEEDRIGREKSRLQEKSIGTGVKSSRGRK